MDFFVEALRDSIGFKVKACAHVLLNEAYHLGANFEIQDKATKPSQLGKRPIGSSFEGQIFTSSKFLRKNHEDGEGSKTIRLGENEQEKHCQKMALSSLQVSQKSGKQQP